MAPAALVSLRYLPLLLLLLIPQTDASFPEDAVSNFREYLRIRTVHPQPDYEAAKNFLVGYGKNLTLDVEVMEFVSGDPVILMTWKGSNPEANSILLNSHMDVVPVEQDKWRHDAFEAVREPSGDIVGRGSQDMKCVGIQVSSRVAQFSSARAVSSAKTHSAFDIVFHSDL